MYSAPPVAQQLDAMREENRRLELEKDRLAEQNGELDTQLQELTRKLELFEEQLACLSVDKRTVARLKADREFPKTDYRRSLVVS